MRSYFSFMQHKSFEIVCNMEIIIYSLFDTGSNFKGLELF
jgi:hypothetical protein